ncbi:glycosyltransferase [Microbulbifer magnicolonia]|uniref:glycosyltransferase n=1 Tax=Microbulbifer magnicolonia TaxID=3109744 RepID=UPI002B40C6A6|nr:glycosyltransferase [Microbulbifer sp. GG15]
MYEAVKDRLLGFLERVNGGNSSHFVFLFSGTTCIQGTRGNRPIRQAQALLRQGIPVLFSYHRNDFHEDVPLDESDLLMQVPVDITLQLLDRIAEVELASTRKVFVVSYPYPKVVPWIAEFKRAGWTVVYDCRDDWEEFSKVGMARWYRKAAERRAVVESQATICVSGPLCDKMRKLAPGSRVKLSPNAVESSFLPAGYHRRPRIAPRVVGYFGHLSDAWFDWSAFLTIARRCPQFRFEIIGHSEPANLDVPSNVELLGAMPWTQLHKVAAGWSAAIIPFRMGKLSDGVDPIKIYEYLSFGLPVVSFRMPQIESYPYTRTVEDVEGFCTALNEVCALTPDRQRIDLFLSRNTWEVRASELLELVEGTKS